jgi:hypothetical protein
METGMKIDYEEVWCHLLCNTYNLNLGTLKQDHAINLERLCKVLTMLETDVHSLCDNDTQSCSCTLTDYNMTLGAKLFMGVRRLSMSSQSNTLVLLLELIYNNAQRQDIQLVGTYLFFHFIRTLEESNELSIVRTSIIIRNSLTRKCALLKSELKCLISELPFGFLSDFHCLINQIEVCLGT